MRLIGGMIVLFVPVLILGRLLPLLVVLVPLVFLFALLKVYLEVWAEKLQRRRWSSFTVDQEWWASPSSSHVHDGAIRLDLTRRWVTFDLDDRETPRCYRAASIQSCRLVREGGVEIHVRGEVNAHTAYPRAKDAHRIVEAIEMLRRSPAKMASPQRSRVSSPS